MRNDPDFELSILERTNSIRPIARGSTFRLPLHLKQMGEPHNCGHRSGWRHVMHHLRLFATPDAILLDDFVERTFQHADQRQVWLEPWVGIFHHPPKLPPWLDPTAPIQAIIETVEFQASLPFLKGAISLSEHLAVWLRNVLPCPVLVRKHPTETPAVRFSIERWEAQPLHQLVQVGWYARNQRGIYQVDVPDHFRKIHLLQDRPWVARAIELTDTFSPYRERSQRGNVRVMHEIDDGQFDELLASSVIFNEYWDLSASNTVIEAVARSTPMVVNNHPALAEYLGADYPLFFDHIDDVKRMLSDRGRIQCAFQHLHEMDKSWLCAAQFAQDVTEFARSVTPRGQEAPQELDREPERPPSTRRIGNADLCATDREAQ